MRAVSKSANNAQPYVRTVNMRGSSMNNIFLAGIPFVGMYNSEELHSKSNRAVKYTSDVYLAGWDFRALWRE